VLQSLHDLAQFFDIYCLYRESLQYLAAHPGHLWSLSTQLLEGVVVAVAAVLVVAVVVGADVAGVVLGVVVPVVISPLQRLHDLGQFIDIHCLYCVSLQYLAAHPGHPWFLSTQLLEGVVVVVVALLVAAVVVGADVAGVVLGGVVPVVISPLQSLHDFGQFLVIYCLYRESLQYLAAHPGHLWSLSTQLLEGVVVAVAAVLVEAVLPPT